MFVLYRKGALNLGSGSKSSTMKEVRKISELLNNLVIYWDFCEISEKEEITRSIFSELSLKEKTLSFKLNPGFKPFESRLVPFSAARRI